MARRIYEDNTGLYFKAYNKDKVLLKVYCDEEGNPLKGVRPVPLEEETSKKSFKGILPIIIAVLGIFLLFFIGYSTYSKIFDSNPKVDLSSGYEVEFTPTGYNGEARAGVKVKKIPTISNVSDEAKKKEIEGILYNPRVTYSKSEGLRSGDNIDVELSFDKAKVEKHKLEITGTYKKTFTVGNLETKPTEPPVASKSDKDTTTTKSAETTMGAKVTTKPSAAAPATVTGPTGIVPTPKNVNVGSVNMRAGSSTATGVITVVPKGGKISEVGTVTNAKGETWSKVVYNGKEGWIRSDLLR